MTPFWIALQFLTTCPVQLKAMPTPKQNGQSLLFYPVVGLLIGAVLWAVVWCLAPVALVLQTAIIVVLWTWLTGGLHYDGLADSADAWVGGFGDRERTLSIMKDPSCGPIGVLSIVITVVLKAAAIYVLLEQDYTICLLMLPCLARTAPLILLSTCNYVRQGGIAQHIAKHLSKKWVLGVILLTVMVTLSLGVVGLLMLLSFAMGLMYLRAKFMQRLGGITGDTIGASIEILETVMILVLAIFLSAEISF